MSSSDGGVFFEANESVGDREVEVPPRILKGELFRDGKNVLLLSGASELVGYVEVRIEDVRMPAEAHARVEDVLRHPIAAQAGYNEARFFRMNGIRRELFLGV